MKQGYRLILRQKEYCKLTFAEMINRFGDSIDVIALTWLIYAISQNPSLSVIDFGLNYLPTIFLQPVAGALIENIPKKRILYLCDIGRGMIVSHYISISMIFIFFGMMCIILTLLLIKLNFKEYF